MIKFYLLDFFVLMIFAACGNRCHIEGTSSLPLLDGKTVYLKIPVGSRWMVSDSCEMNRGAFSMTHFCDSAVLATLFIDDEALMPLALENGNVKVTLNNARLQAEGTPLNDRLYDFLAGRSDLNGRIEEVERNIRALIMDGLSHGEAIQRYATEKDSIMKAKDRFINDFMRQNYENILGPNVFLMLCSTLPYPMITPLMEKVLNEAPHSFIQNPYIQEYITAAKENMRLMSAKE